MKALAARIGNEKFIGLLHEITGELARKGMAGKSLPKRDFATWVAGLKSPPPLYQHALVYEIVEDSAQAFEFRITQCLWAKAFREEDAADIGYASVCYPNFAVAGLQAQRGSCHHRGVPDLWTAGEHPRRDV
jgi:hypothetical protein